jgi:FtsP/CotA-like multicopper oxidase with cupredoxin domain
LSKVHNKKLETAMVVTTLAVAVAALAYISFNPLPGRSQPTNTAGVSCPAYYTNFVVIANERGYNDSIDHGVPQNYWPVLCAHQGDTVTIKVENTGTEPHGFAIDHYYPQGASLAVGNNLTITFIADQKGAFLIYCTVLCAVHPWMLSGLLVVR